MRFFCVWGCWHEGNGWRFLQNCVEWPLYGEKAQKKVLKPQKKRKLRKKNHRTRKKTHRTRKKKPKLRKNPPSKLPPPPKWHPNPQGFSQKNHKTAQQISWAALNYINMLYIKSIWVIFLPFPRVLAHFCQAFFCFPAKHFACLRRISVALSDVARSSINYIIRYVFS
ncbi:hypothetical protein FIU87_18950 [Bacillus sp. THAF10]|nr:hypothetical protein FIU87_18950 [Bacillus sp. THAF10]